MAVRPLTYGPPNIPFDEMVRLFKQRFNMSITKADIINPADPALLQDCFYKFAEDFTEAAEGLIQPRLTPDLDRPDEMENFIYLSNLYSVLNQLLKRIGYHDFLFSDLIQPKTKRTQLVLSQLFNYHRFCVMKLAYAERVRDTMVQLFRMKESYATQAPLLQRQIGDVTNSITVAREELNEIENSIPEQQQMLKRAVDSKHDRKDAKSAINISVESRTNELLTLQATVEELTSTDNALQEQVAESPEEIERNISSRQEELRQLRADTQQARSRADMLDEQERNHRCWENTTATMQKIMRDITTEMAKSSEVAGLMSKRERRRQELNEQIADALAVHTARLGELVRLKELSQSLLVRQQAKLENLKTQIKEAKKKRDSCGTVLNQNCMVAETMADELKLLREESEETEREVAALEATVKRNVERCMELLELFDKYVMQRHLEMEAVVDCALAKVDE